MVVWVFSFLLSFSSLFFWFCFHGPGLGGLSCLGWPSPTLSSHFVPFSFPFVLAWAGPVLIVLSPATAQTVASLVATWGSRDPEHAGLGQEAPFFLFFFSFQFGLGFNWKRCASWFHFSQTITPSSRAQVTVSLLLPLLLAATTSHQQPKPDASHYSSSPTFDISAPINLATECTTLLVHLQLVTQLPPWTRDPDAVASPLRCLEPQRSKAPFS